MKFLLGAEHESPEEAREASNALWMLSIAVRNVTKECGDYRTPRLGSTLNYDLERGLVEKDDYPDILQSRVESCGCALNAGTGEILFAEGIIPSKVLDAMREIHQTMVKMEASMGDRTFESYGIHFTEVEP